MYENAANSKFEASTPIYETGSYEFDRAQFEPSRLINAVASVQECMLGDIGELRRQVRQLEWSVQYADGRIKALARQVDALEALLTAEREMRIADHKELLRAIGAKAEKVKCAAPGNPQSTAQPD